MARMWTFVFCKRRGNLSSIATISFSKRTLLLKFFSLTFDLDFLKSYFFHSWFVMVFFLLKLAALCPLLSYTGLKEIPWMVDQLRAQYSCASAADGKFRRMQIGVSRSAVQNGTKGKWLLEDRTKLRSVLYGSGVLYSGMVYSHFDNIMSYYAKYEHCTC